MSGPFARSGDAARLIELELEKRQRHPVRAAPLRGWDVRTKRMRHHAEFMETILWVCFKERALGDVF